MDIKEVCKLRQKINYNPAKGEFSWPDGHQKRGRKVGYLRPDGYTDIQISGVKYKAHHRAWIIYYGFKPNKIIDCIDGDRGNIRISNLKLITIEDSRKIRPKVKIRQKNYLDDPMTKKQKAESIRQIKEYIRYDPATGKFDYDSEKVKRVTTPNCYLAGPESRSFMICGRVYRPNRVAWALMHDDLPSKRIKYIDGNPANNKITNLDLAGV